MNCRIHIGFFFNFAKDFIIYDFITNIPKLSNMTKIPELSIGYHCFFTIFKSEMSKKYKKHKKKT